MVESIVGLSRWHSGIVGIFQGRLHPCGLSHWNRGAMVRCYHLIFIDILLIYEFAAGRFGQGTFSDLKLKKRPFLSLSEIPLRELTCTALSSFWPLNKSMSIHSYTHTYIHTVGGQGSVGEIKRTQMPDRRLSIGRIENHPSGAQWTWSSGVLLQSLVRWKLKVCPF